MDIHKPKAAHSLREFAIEIGTIICGILIALGLEQSVDYFHRRHEAHEAEEGLRASIQLNLVGAAQRVAIQPCLAARVVHLKEKLAVANGNWLADPDIAPVNAGYPVNVPGAVHNPLRRMLLSSWQAALSSPALMAVPVTRRTLYAGVFEYFAGFNALEDREQAAQGDLTALGFDVQLTPETRARYLDRLGALSDSETVIAATSSFALDRSRAAGLRPDPALLARIIAQEKQLRGSCVRDVKF